MRQEIVGKGGGTYARKTWVLSLDVSEVPDLAKLTPIPGNAARFRDLLDCYNGKTSSSDYNPRSFYLDDAPNLTFVDKRFQQGWKEGAEKALKLADGLVDNVTQPLSIRRRVRFSDDGDEFDRERLIDGHLDQAWRTTSRQMAVATPIINIATAWGGNAHMSHDQLFWSGAAAIALVRILEAAGYQTSLTAVMPNVQSSGNYLAVCATVKAAGEYLRPDAIASTLCYGPTFRTYGFLAIVGCPWQTDSSLGSMTEIAQVIPAAIDTGMIERPQIVIPSCYNEAAAKSAIMAALSELQAANLAALPEEIVRKAEGR